jgi:uncharacterized protein
MPTTLTAGDLAIIGFSADTTTAPGAVPKSLSFVVLREVEAGTVISYTDNGWLAAGGFRANEGTGSFTFASGASAGTVVTISGLTGTLNPSTAGDQFLIYQGPSASPTFLYAVDFADGNTSFAGDATSSNTSAIPPGLTAGSTALAFGTDNGAYTGSTIGSPEQLRAAIANPANWTLNDANPVPYATAFTVLGGITAVSINDVSLSEGDAGQTLFTFTVSRSDNAGAFSVDFATAPGTADSADFAAAGGTLTFTPGGALTQQVTVAVNGDTAPEAAETFFVNLSNLVITAGNTSITDAQGVGTIRNDDIAFRRIFEIQGAGHTSPFAGQEVRTTGVVTARDTNGFWMQDATGDGDIATSDGIFVFTGSAPAVTVGQAVQVAGLVTEFRPQNNANNLTITEITNATVTVTGAGSIAPTVLGAGGRAPPTSVIDDDGATSFDPATDGLDFYESLEGMLVLVPDARATDLTDGGLTWVLADGGAGATGVNGRGGITISASDFNPERIGVFVDTGVLPGFTPAYDMGDSLGNVTGVVSYFGGNYEVIATSIGNTGSGGSNTDEVSALVGDAIHLTIAAYNLENLDPTDPAQKFATLAGDIVGGLRSPDIIGVEEIQDADGAGGGSNLSGAATAQRLIDAIVAAGGPTYRYVEVAPTTPGGTGGEPGGNIRNGFLYNPERVTYIAGSAELIDGPAFANSRRPLVAQFDFRGETVTVIDVHSTSRGGSEQLFGAHQPPVNAGDAARIAQSEAIRAYVLQLQAADPDAHVAVMGDFNAFHFERALTLLEEGGSLVNLSALLPANERWSYVFEGNAQQLDHLLVSPGLAEGAQFDIVHLNAGVAGFRGTDHDPVLGRFEVNTGPTAVDDAVGVLENQSVTFDVLANDNDPNTGDDGTVVSVSATARGATVAIVGNQVRYTADVPEFDLLAPGETTTDSFTYVMRDAGGETSTATVTVTVAGAPDGPTQVGGNGHDTLMGTSLDERLEGGNGSDRLLGGAGADSLYGGNGQDELIGGGGIDLLVGGLGGDRFVFEGAFGRDTVADYGPGDRIVLDDAQFADFAAVLARAAQVGDDVVITVDAANSITLSDVLVADLKANGFLFV